MHSSLIKRHFLDPANVGEIESADAVAKAASLSCGAFLRISLSVDPSQRITDAKFKATGCSYLVAALSVLTQKVIGQTTAEAAAQAQSPVGLESFGSEWPGNREQCASLACQGLLSAIQSYSAAVRDEWSGDDALICTCFSVSEQTIERKITAGDLRTIAEVTRASNAGAGCRSCYPLIEDMLSQHWREADLIL